jgi:urease accessory protein
MMPLTDQSLLRLLQLTDSTFPTGSFAHSFGLETYIARGSIRTAAALEEYIANILLHAVAPSDGVACRLMLQAGAEWESLMRRLDHRLTAMKVVSETRQASRTLGTRFLRTATQIFPCPRATAYLREVEAQELHGHISLAYGLLGADLELPMPAALTAWFRQQCAALVSVGVRLIPLGQTAGQVVLARLGKTVFEAIELASTKDLEDMGSLAPGQELAGIMHRDVLTTRLYIS